MRPLRNLKLVGLALLLVALIGTAGFHYLEGWSWFDSLYMVVITFSTVGYREVHELSQAGKLFNLFVLLSGVGLVFLGIGVLAQTLLEFELQKFFGRRRMERDISRLSGHYIICGAGRVGRAVAAELARKPVPFVVIESSAAKLEKLSETWLSVTGDATQEEALRRARIEQAQGLVAATTTDASNIYIVLTARGINPRLKIIARASEEEAAKHLRTAGADSVVSPYSFAGHRIAQSFLRPNVLDFLDIATGREQKLEVEIEEVLVEEGSRVAGMSIGDSKIHQSMGVIILAIKRDGAAMRFNPSAGDRIQSGDNLIAVGQASGLRQLEEAASGPAGTR